MSQIGAINDNLRPPGLERRATARQRVLFAGKLICLQNGLSADCTVRDLSSCGARIKADLPQTTAVGSALLVVRQGVLHEYALAWRREAQAGLRFLSATDLTRAEPLPTNLIPWRQLWLALTPR